jgi:two-component system, cell cycle response regulator DivK
MAGECILLVEDNPVNRRLAEFLLRAKGFTVIEVSTGEEALQKARGEQPALIIMDLQLAGMDGFTATRRLKADPATRHIPVIAMTAYAMSGDRERALEAGCDGYITKPIDTREFPLTIGRHLTSREKNTGTHDAGTGEDPGR